MKIQFSKTCASKKLNMYESSIFPSLISNNVNRFPFLNYKIFEFIIYTTVTLADLLAYRIRTNRTQLSIRTPGDTLSAHYDHFDETLQRKHSILDKNLPQITLVQSNKILNFDRTPEFYLRGYGSPYS